MRPASPPPRLQIIKEVFYMSSNLSRRSFLKVMAAGAASVAAAGAVGLPVLDSAKAEVEEKLAEIERLNMKIREQKLMLGSFEARWEIRKPTPGTEEVQIPRRPPLARDDRRREVCA